MDSGSIGFVMICAAFVFFMTPGLSYFYGGLVRRKNAVNTMFASVITIGTGIVMWVLFGYSLAFGTDHFGIIGDFSWLGLEGVSKTEPLCRGTTNSEYGLLLVPNDVCRYHTSFDYRCDCRQNAV